MSKPIFYEGQAVGCLIYGEGKLTEIKDVYIYVDYGDFIRTYNSDGSFFNNSRPILYPLSQYREIIANLPAPQPEAWKPKPGEWCWFWLENAEGCPLIAQFVRMSNGKYTMINLNTEWEYTYCAPFTGELPEHLKEVQP